MKLTLQLFAWTIIILLNWSALDALTTAFPYIFGPLWVGGIIWFMAQIVKGLRNARF